ncbi:RNA polymerase sigma factor [Pedobacter rhizosphaerae]|uniref:RNA polymerase, sigma subunit, ECF family n=1 Tax=Pedobacter rhizosphaerae TaxID=390241 RepID=A0A1H9TIZ5_9SPHI|nr:RNA polymerase sigma factor [Pedobacter rhizosphaerae]SER96954.1 RNA polymerase, sigma subunit, ECF family [Pedobacter rhizosphaerae]
MENRELVRMLEKQSPQLRAHALKFTGDIDDANDLVQDTLIKALRFQDSFEEGSNLKGWLFVILKNTFINSYKKSRQKRDLIKPEDELSPGELIPSSIGNKALNSFLMADIQTALAKVPESYRIPFVRYFEGYKYHEIAEELGIPLGTVKTHIHQARLMLKKQLKAYNLDRQKNIN